MAAKYPGRLKVAKVNVDNSPQVSQQYDAMSIPTLLLIRDGAVVDRLIGAVPEAQLDAFVQRGLA
jgi:thioredoxin 1